ncbi:di-trans,poly-cis-decaprenylcistransferase [Occultella glacieicola]|uniref:Isoprenyl transferase n=1 Tax=Occultella glacieicola TaxID=2518684 RepID=A0ABY2E146_9MICO|nr:polyprenyl diphosphate synthase [Occultella glacieicola]TDE91674.1 di-trans,poly-cis-decaprenylcistransferase [Occultella glacieicola]
MGGAVEQPLPRHVGIVMDGNRRWAQAIGQTAGFGHRAGADHLGDALEWLRTRGVDHVSVFVLSVDNIRKRSAQEVGHLFGLIESVLPATIERSQHWQVHISGDLALAPPGARRALRRAVELSRGRAGQLTLGIGYDPHADIVAGVRAALADGAAELDGEDLVRAIGERLPGGPVRDIDLVIRTSGERRISGFFPWQAARAEIVFSPKMWPAFTEADLDAALAEYARRRVAVRI